MSTDTAGKSSFDLLEVEHPEFVGLVNEQAFDGVADWASPVPPLDRVLAQSILLKRLIDLPLAVLCGLVVLPMVAIIALLVKLSSRGPVFFSGKRIGAGGRHFYAWKFRTMRTDAEQVLEEHLAKCPELRRQWEETQKLKNDPRVTRLGRFLRKASLDELPQLLNVLKGDMSLVGPRPIVDQEVCRYGDVFKLYCSVLPGITGLWQISGRNNTTYEERVGYDATYVRNWSVWLDLSILVRTAKVVLLQEGAY